MKFAPEKEAWIFEVWIGRQKNRRIKSSTKRGMDEEPDFLRLNEKASDLP